MPPDLWNFALACYARPGVEPLCLQLQEQGADVCLLLCGLWLERRGAACTTARLEQLLAIAEPWQRQVVGPLRELRRGWKAAAQNDPQQTRLREQIKALELEAEHELLRRLERLAATWPQEAAAPAATWLERLSQDHGALEGLRAAVRTP